MEKSKEFYCWFRVRAPKVGPASDAVNQRTDERPEGNADAGSLQDADDPDETTRVLEHLLELSRRGALSQSAVQELLLTIKNGGRPPFSIRNGGRPPGRYGGSRMSGWWLMDDTMSGLPYDVDYAPIPGDRDDAVAWLETEEGRTWLAGSLSYFLMSFISIGND